jgi:hypothetical protein
MLKVVKRPKEYIAIKVPEDCEDVGRFVIKEAKAAGIHLHIATTYYDHADKWVTKIDTRDHSHTVNQGSVIVVPDVADEYSAYVMSQKDFDNLFKPADEPAKSIKAEMSTKIKGVTLPDHKNVPHVRIEFDDINDVPHVWIDGKRIDRSDTGLVSVSLDWHTKDPAATDHVIRAYKIEYLKGDHREGIAQGSPMGPDLFKNDIHAK